MVVTSAQPTLSQASNGLEMWLSASCRRELKAFVEKNKSSVDLYHLDDKPILKAVNGVLLALFNAIVVFRGWTLLSEAEKEGSASASPGIFGLTMS